MFHESSDRSAGGGQEERFCIYFLFKVRGKEHHHGVQGYAGGPANFLLGSAGGGEEEELRLYSHNSPIIINMSISIAFYFASAIMLTHLRPSLFGSLTAQIQGPDDTLLLAPLNNHGEEGNARGAANFLLNCEIEGEVAVQMLKWTTL
jgi:hypothetical protein